MTRPRLTVGSLFSGIGGLDLGLERAGMTVVWQSEIDPYCTKVLAKHWPGVPNLGDVTLIDWSEVPRVDVICGGYPCQPFSQAGRRLGEEDPRHLWPWMLDAIRVLRPRYALLENVPGHLALGFGRVLGDLAEIGYDTEWDCIPAAAVGAPHRRDRVFIVAHPDRGRLRRLGSDTGDGGTVPGEREFGIVRGGGRSEGHVADTERKGRGRPLDPEPRRREVPLGGERHSLFGGRGVSRRGPWWDVEPDVGRVAHGVPHRVDRLRALGNAVVPQVAEHIGRLITEAAS